jgi:hypothetical protein
MYHADLIPWEELPQKQKDINLNAFKDVFAVLQPRAEAVIREAMQKAIEEAVKAVGRVIADEMCVDASDESHQWLKTALAAVQAAASSLTEQETTK